MRQLTQRPPGQVNERMPGRRSTHQEPDCLWHGTPLEEIGRKEGAGLPTGMKKEIGHEGHTTKTLQDTVTPEGTHHQVDRGQGLNPHHVRQENRSGEGREGPNPGNRVPRDRRRRNVNQGSAAPQWSPVSP